MKKLIITIEANEIVLMAIKPVIEHQLKQMPTTGDIKINAVIE